MQVQGVLYAGEIFGEIGALCSVPQPFTICTTKISQLLRVNTTVLKNIIEENKDDEQIVLNNVFQVFTVLYKMVLCYIIYLLYVERKINVSINYLQKTAQDQRFSTEVSRKYHGKLNQEFRKPNSYSAFNQVSQENESEAKGRVTSCFRNECCKELNESERHSHGTIHKTAKQDDFNRINDFPAKGESKEKHILTNLMCMESMYRGKADVHEQILPDSSLNGSEEDHVITQSLLEHTKKGSIRSEKDGSSVVLETKRVTIHVYSQQNKNYVPCAKVIKLPGSLDELFNIACKYS